MTFAHRRNRLTTHFSERIPVVKRRTSVLIYILKIYVGRGCTIDSPAEERDDWWPVVDVVTNIWEFTKLSE